jgi:hypothetical protein
MIPKILSIAALSCFISGTAMAGDQSISCKNNAFGCNYQVNLSYSQNKQDSSSWEQYAYNSRPKFFKKDGKQYMLKDGKLYYYKSLSYLPADPYASPSAFPSRGPVNQFGTFVFDPKKFGWAAYDANGNLVKSGAASGGSEYCIDLGTSCRTPAGTYTVYSEGSSECISHTYPLHDPGSAMPYCMFFHGGYAIHGSDHVPRYNASHGCIRVHPVAARWLNREFIHKGTTVVVKSYN